MMALTGVSTLALRISRVVRTGASGTSLTRPSAIRLDTSPMVSPVRPPVGASSPFIIGCRRTRSRPR